MKKTIKKSENLTDMINVFICHSEKSYKALVNHCFFRKKKDSAFNYKMQKINGGESPKYMIITNFSLDFDTKSWQISQGEIKWI